MTYVHGVPWQPTSSLPYLTVVALTVGALILMIASTFGARWISSRLQRAGLTVFALVAWIAASVAGSLIFDGFRSSRCFPSINHNPTTGLCNPSWNRVYLIAMGAGVLVIIYFGMVEPQMRGKGMGSTLNVFGFAMAAIAAFTSSWLVYTRWTGCQEQSAFCGSSGRNLIIGTSAVGALMVLMFAVGWLRAGRPEVSELGPDF